MLAIQPQNTNTYLPLFIFKKALRAKVTFALLRFPLVRSPVTLNTLSAKACEAGIANRSNANGFKL